MEKLTEKDATLTVDQLKEYAEYLEDRIEALEEINRDAAKRGVGFHAFGDQGELIEESVNTLKETALQGGGFGLEDPGGLLHHGHRTQIGQFGLRNGGRRLQLLDQLLQAGQIVRSRSGGVGHRGGVRPAGEVPPRGAESLCLKVPPPGAESLWLLWNERDHAHSKRVE